MREHRLLLCSCTMFWKCTFDPAEVSNAMQPRFIAHSVAHLSRDKRPLPTGQLFRVHFGPRQRPLPRRTGTTGPSERRWFVKPTEFKSYKIFFHLQLRLLHSFAKTIYQNVFHSWRCQEIHWNRLSCSTQYLRNPST